MNQIEHIRKNVLCVLQTELAAIAGVTQSTISRWESGDYPSLDHMKRIRATVLRRKIPWEDAWFFEVPKKPRPRRRV